jgi:hypothetical protein
MCCTSSIGLSRIYEKPAAAMNYPHHRFSVAPMMDWITSLAASIGYIRPCAKRAQRRQDLIFKNMLCLLT